MPDRAALASDFLRRSGWGAARRVPLAGDASARRYERLTSGDRTAVFMDAPPGQADDVADFLRIARHLTRLGLSAPRCFAEDIALGFLLLEDLGDGLFARLLERDTKSESSLYAAAVDVLLQLQSAPAPTGLTDLRPEGWAEAACLATDWYRRAITNDTANTDEFRKTLEGLIAHHADGPRVLILRDYHAENLIWLPDRSGTARVGLLDFQLAQLGQPGYDLVSLCQDARRDVSPETERLMIEKFVSSKGITEAEFLPAYATLGAQRALRIIGIFARLSLVSGKPAYVGLIPRVWAQLQRNLSHPALSPLAEICAQLLPEPTDARLERIRALCGSQTP